MDLKQQKRSTNLKMTRKELEDFLAAHDIYQIADFIIRKQVERYSDGFDVGYDLGYNDGAKAAQHAS